MSESKGNIHKDHRERVKSRFRAEGLDHFAEVHALELLLFYAIPQGDTNPVAHRLLDHFGSLAQVLNAPAEELEKVKGVGKHTSTLLNLTRDLCRYYMIQEQKACDILQSTRACGEYLVPYFVGKRDETVCLLCLDSKCKVICCKEICSGSVNATAVSVRKVVEAALNANATSVVLAHNHPTGFALPSDEDLLTTLRVGRALDAVGVVLADHIVVADSDYISMAESGLYNPADCVSLI